MTPEREKEIREIVAKALDADRYTVAASIVRSGFSGVFEIVMRAMLPLLDAAESEAARGREAIEACVQCVACIKFADTTGSWPAESGPASAVEAIGSAELARREAAKPKPRFVVSPGGRVWSNVEDTHAKDCIAGHGPAHGDEAPEVRCGGEAVSAPIPQEYGHERWYSEQTMAAVVKERDALRAEHATLTRALDAAQARIAELERDLAVAQEATAACGECGCEWARRAETAEAALAAQAWVPCSERMPDPGQLVMVSIAEYSAIDRTLRTCVRLDVRKPTHGWQSESPVVAWRPLPAPWEGDKA